MSKQWQRRVEEDELKEKLSKLEKECKQIKDRLSAIHWEEWGEKLQKEKSDEAARISLLPKIGVYIWNEKHTIATISEFCENRKIVGEGRQYCFKKGIQLSFEKSLVEQGVQDGDKLHFVVLSCCVSNVDDVEIERKKSLK